MAPCLAVDLSVSHLNKVCVWDNYSEFRSKFSVANGAHLNLQTFSLIFSLMILSQSCSDLTSQTHLSLESARIRTLDLDVSLQNYIIHHYNWSLEKPWDKSKLIFISMMIFNGFSFSNSVSAYSQFCHVYKVSWSSYSSLEKESFYRNSKSEMANILFLISTMN